MASTATAAGSGQVLRATLPNGLRVVIVRNTLAPVVTTEVNYRVGSNEAPTGFPGTAHAQEHMMFRGSPGLSANQLADITAAMGGDFDADTQQTVTQYFFTVPARDLDVALHIEAIRMRGVSDGEKQWSQERKAIEQEVAQDLSDPSYRLYARLLAAAFAGTPYAHDALGTRPSFDKTSAAALKRFHDTWYVPNNAVLVVVGDVQPRQALARIKSLFGGLPRKPTPARPAVHLKPLKASTLHLDTDAPNGRIVMAFRMPGYHSRDFAAAQVLADVLSSPRGSLYALVADGQALSADFALDQMPDVGLGYATATFPKNGDAKALIAKVQHRLTHIVRKGVPSDLVAAAKRDELTAAELQKNSIAGLASAWSEAVAVEGRRSPAADVQAIRAVSVADVNRVARRYIDLHRDIVAVLRPQSSGAPVAAKGYGGKESFSPAHTSATKLPHWAARALERTSVPHMTSAPVSMRLPNGLRLIVQPETISDTISVYGHVRNRPQLETPPGQEGVDRVLDRLFTYGTSSLDRVAYQKALDAVGADETGGTDFGVQVLATHFKRAVELLADNVLHPRVHKDDFRIVRKQVAGSVAGELQSPDYLARHALLGALFPPHDPDLRHPTPPGVAALTRNDVVAYYRRVFRPDLTTIVVIGKVTPARARQIIEHYFGAWRSHGHKPTVDLSPVPPNKPARVFVPNRSRVQMRVTLAETVGITRYNPDYYALQLGNHVLGGGFYATRLYRDLRERGGLVYYVGSSLEAGKTRALYFVGYACDPANVAKARALVERDLRQMQVQTVDPAQFRRAKALAIRRIALNESSVDAIAEGLITRSSLNLPLDEPQRAARRYARLTPEQVKAAYAKWLRVGDLVQVTEGPTAH